MYATPVNFLWPTLVEMSQGQSRCNNQNAAVVQNSYGQLTGTSRLDILTSAITYVDSQTQPPKAVAVRGPLSSGDYVAYKKAQILANSKPGVWPTQTVIITDLRAFNAVYP